MEDSQFRADDPPNDAEQASKTSTSPGPEQPSVVREDSEQSSVVREDSGQSSVVREDSGQSSVVREDSEQSSVVREDSEQSSVVREDTVVPVEIQSPGHISPLDGASVGELEQQSQDTSLSQSAEVEVTDVESTSIMEDQGKEEEPPAMLSASSLVDGLKSLTETSSFNGQERPIPDVKQVDQSAEVQETDQSLEQTKASTIQDNTVEKVSDDPKEMDCSLSSVSNKIGQEQNKTSELDISHRDSLQTSTSEETEVVRGEKRPASPVEYGHSEHDFSNLEEPSRSVQKEMGTTCIEAGRSPIEEQDHTRESSEENEAGPSIKRLRTPVKSEQQQQPLKQTVNPSDLFHEKTINGELLSDRNIVKAEVKKKRRGRPPRLDKAIQDGLPKSVQTTDAVSTLIQKHIVKKTDESPARNALRRPKEMDQMDNAENLSFFLPENWFFVGSIRQLGANVGAVDMYYWTPPPRVKLRSRQELLAYMNAHNLNYDPLQFFIRKQVFPLIEKGVLKYYDSKTIVLAASDEAVLSEVHVAKPKLLRIANSSTEGNVKGVADKSKQNSHLKLKGFPFKKSKNMKPSRITLKRVPKVERLSPTAKLKVASPKANYVKTRERSLSVSAAKPQIPLPEAENEYFTERTLDLISAKMQALSPEAVNTKKTDKSLSIIAAKSQVPSPEVATKKMNERKLSTLSVKPELASPESANRRLRERNLTASVPKLQELSPDRAIKRPREENLSTPPKKPRGRPKKVPSPMPAAPASPPQSNTSLEERVRIQPKPKIVRSPYFSSINALAKPKSSAGLRKDRSSCDAPPRSPFNLIQEDLFHDPWQMLIATIFLNSTSGRVAIPLALEFLKRWPTPQKACQAKLYDILDVIEPLGFGRTRAAIIIRFSHEFLTKDWKLPNDLYGIGKYGTDSYKIFCMKNAWKKVESDDPMLMMYLNWRRATEHLRKKFRDISADPTIKDPDDTVYTFNTSSVNLVAPHKGAKGKSPPSPRKKLRTRTATK